jgi:CRISPR-associated protein Csh1
VFAAIRKLGIYVIQDEGKDEESVLIQESKLGNIKKIICVMFEIGKDSVAYEGTHLEEYDSYDSEKARKYLYRTFSHGRYDLTPTTRILSPEKLRQRTLLWFKEYSPKYEDWLIKALNEEINRRNEDIFSEVASEYAQLPREDRNVIFTIKFKEGEEEKYLGDYPIFRKLFKEEALKKFFYKYDVESKNVGTCCLCGESKEVFGFASPFSFYTLDKKGFAPNFLQEEAWKCLPICAECAISLESGKEFLNKYLLKSFYGFRFYVIPKFIFGDITKDVMEDVKAVADKKKYAESLLCVEDNIGILEEKGNKLNLDFMFIKSKQKDFFDIVRYVEDVPPSWIKVVHDSLKEIQNQSLFKEEQLKKILGKKQVGSLEPYLGGLVRPFFPGPNYDKYFIEIVASILAQKPIDKQLLIQAFMREIRDSHVNEKTWEEKFLCLKSFMLLLLINNLKLAR